MFATVLDEFPTPACARLLSLEVLDAQPEAGRIRVAFEARPEFCNASGHIQGGLLAAMLDDTMGPAMIIATAGERAPTTISLTVSYLAPAKPGRLIGEGWVVQLGQTIGFLEATLTDEAGQVIARASSSARLVRLPPRPARDEPAQSEP